MTGKATILLISILLLTVSGCGTVSISTDAVLETPTPYQEVSEPITAAPTVLSTNTAVVYPTSTAVSEPLSLPATAVESEPLFSLPTRAVTALMPADFSPILYGKKYDANTFFLLLGGVQGNTWLAPDQASAMFGGEWEYDVHTFTQGSFQVLGQAPEFSPVNDRKYFLGTNAKLNEIGMVGVLRGWPIRQAETQALSPDNETYQQVVIDWLKQNGISAPELGTMQVFRVDLEADGVDEIFISATHIDDVHIAKPGDYSILLMRKVVGNDAVTVAIVSDVYTAQQEVIQPPYYSFVNFIDLNRDNLLEVVVEIQGWEKFGAIVFQIKGQTVTEVLQ